MAVTARTESALEQVVATIESAGGEAMAITADLTQPDAARDVVEKVRGRFGPVEVLVNNAGVGSSANPKPIVDYDDDFWQLLMDVNLTAPYRFCKLVLPDMLAAGWGRVITVASICSKIGTLHAAAYVASKHGVLGLMRTLAVETAGTGITVNCICPGPVKTVMNDLRFEYDAKRTGQSFEQVEAGSTPIGRRLLPDEIAPIAVYFAGEEAACVTGQAWNLDGGVVMSA